MGGTGRLDVAGINGGAVGIGVMGGEKKERMSWAHVSATEKRKGATGERHMPEEKAPFRECAKGFWADWDERRGGSR
jgi:hypothetical protein